MPRRRERCPKCGATLQPRKHAVAAPRKGGPVSSRSRTLRRDPLVAWRSVAEARRTAPQRPALPKPPQLASAEIPDASPARKPGGGGQAARNRTGATGRKPARGVRRRRRPPQPWYRRWRVTVPLALVLLVLTAVGAGAWYINAQFDTINQISTPPPEISGEHIGGDESITIDTNPARLAVEQVRATSETAEAPPDNLVTILVMGVDAREGEAIDVNVRADSLGVVLLDKDTHSCRMLSIPRDTWALLPGYGYTKINSALAVGGVPYQQLVVEDLLGVEIDHYGLIDFSGLTRVVDAIGGITVVNDYAFTIEDETTVYPFPRGELELDGRQALMYSRYREGPDGDFGRQERQQRVVRAIMREGADLDAVRVIPNMLSLVEGHVRTDLGPSDMVDLAQEFRSGCTAESLETERLHGVIEPQYDDLMEEFLSFVVIDDAEIHEKSSWLTGEDD